MSADNEQREDYWRPHVEACQASGLSAKRFCRDNALPYGQFLYWAGKLRPSAATPPASGFTRVVPRSGAVTLEGLHITLPNGLRIGGITAGNVELLSTPLAQL